MSTAASSFKIFLRNAKSRTLYFIGLQLLFTEFANAQAGWWTWMKGDNTIYSTGNLGTQGTPSANNYPRALYSATGWTDLQGNFWIFGGDGGGVSFSDLMMYNPVTDEWTWVAGTGLANQPGNWGTKGVPSPNNYPSSRTYGVRSWTDHNGDLWLLGGYGYDANGSNGDLNDLWRYNIATNEWTWMAGNNTVNANGVYGTLQVPDVNNTPGARHECTAAWTDLSGNLWCYGGYNFSQAFCDMWKFDVSINEWVWMSGSSGSLNPSYGVQGIPSASNTPGSRLAYSHSTDVNGNFWLFGGANYNITPYADLWKYDPSINEWAWINGSQITSDPGNAGAQCDTSSLYYPKARFENRCSWTDNCGHFWITGGTSDFFTSSLSDLWVFDPSTYTWALANGSLNANINAVTGTQGVAAASNNPGGLICSIGFVDQSNDLFLFGGAVASLAPLNNLWRFQIDPDCPALNYNCNSSQPPVFSASDTSLCEKFCIDFFDSSQNNPTSWQWFFPGGSPSSSTAQNPTNICYDVPGVYDVTLITTSANGSDTTTLTGFITVNATPAFPTISQNGYVLTSSPSSTYQWQFNSYDIPGATNQSYTVTQTGYYTVIVGDANGCKNSSSIYILISGINDALNNSGLSIYPNPSSGIFYVEFTHDFAGENISVDVVNALGQKVFSASEKKSPGEMKKEINLGNAARGVYFLEVKSDQEFLKKKIIITN